jgi:hypothetical protein
MAQNLFVTARTVEGHLTHACQKLAIWAMSGRSPIGTLGEDESIGSVSCRRWAQEVRMAPMRVGLAGMPMRQPGAPVAKACTGCDGRR